MIRIEIDFIAGRFHASAWDVHVNEGRVEWPPSPARLVRAVLAMSYRDAERPGVPPASASRLLEKLSTALPTFFVPPGRAAHARHYMPVEKTTTKVVDSFLRFEDDRRNGWPLGAAPLFVDWPVVLTPDESTYLAVLLDRLSYLGRAESWIEARLGDPTQALDAEYIEVTPSTDVDATLRLLAPETPESIAAWFDPAVERVLDREAKTRGKVLSKEQKAKIEAQIPTTLVEALSMQTSDVQKAGWSEPPGLRWCTYRSTDALDRPTTQTRDVRGRRVDRTTCIVLTLASNAIHREVLPPMERVVRYAEIVHAALASHTNGRSSRVLLGKSEDGASKHDHDHLHILPLDLVRTELDPMRRKGQIAHLLLWAPTGFEPADIDAVRSLRRIRREKQNDRDTVAGRYLFATITVVGGRKEVNAFCTATGSRPLVGSSRVFRSVTPYVPARHLKARHTIEDDVHRELTFRPSLLPDVVSPETTKIEPLDRMERVRMRDFIRYRAPRRRRPPTSSYFALRLSFADEVTGPIALGYGSHFGLGLFAPVDD